MTTSWSVLELLLRAARRHVDNPRLSQRERDYIARVWLPADPVPEAGQAAAFDRGVA